MAKKLNVFKLHMECNGDLVLTFYKGVYRLPDRDKIRALKLLKSINYTALHFRKDITNKNL
jgi:hypothetical protein